uniref:Uncharacterized protein n=2 Tax=Culex quinquefasciatus TaxID=7176 RepID=A0A1S4KHE3_CULQU
MEQEISALCPTAIQIEGIEIKVHTTMILSMVDTKVVNDITETVSQACFICSKSGRRLNDAVESTAEDLGICSQVFSPLHAKIRSMEQFLNIAYKMTLDEPKWRVSKNNGTVTDRQDTIRQSLRDELGLRISAAVPGGGNSNDGNTADVFFANVAVVSRITGLDEELLERISALLTVLNSRERIDAAAYRLYAEETRKLYIKLYDWYPLSPTLHKILVHGADIIKRSLLPIGMLSEEAQEARNKSIRKFRQFHARKFNRTVNLEDLILTGLRKGLSAHLKGIGEGPTVLLDTVPLLKRVISPSLRSVSLQLLTPKEKSDLTHTVEVMADFGLNYIQLKSAEGTYQYQLDPDLEQLGQFQGVSPQNLSYFGKQIVAREVELEQMRRAQPKSAAASSLRAIAGPALVAKKSRPEPPAKDKKAALPNHLQTLQPKQINVSKVKQ